MDKLSPVALKNNSYSLYFEGKRAEITIHIIKHKIEYSITQAEEMFKLAQKLNNPQGDVIGQTMPDDCLYDDRPL